ncbi:MAG: hypothetical protein JO073_00875 [Actinobacteria bacterium]|nr:hypothetical protein [Actinomycetota bacterium]
MQAPGSASRVALLAVALVAAVAAALPASAGVRVVHDWPCAGCIVQVPAGVTKKHPAPLLVALHGDEGVPTLAEEVWAPVAAAKRVILFTPQCPTSLGCQFQNGAGVTNSWWGWLQYSHTYDDAWLGEQVAAIAARYAVDPHRRYLTGWSGGADYLGWYAARHASTFAAAAFVAGGVPYTQSCPSRTMGAYFLLGAADPRYLSQQPSQVAGVFQRCGDPTQVTVIPGADHQGSISSLAASGYASTILSWLLGFRH